MIPPDIKAKLQAKVQAEKNRRRFLKDSKVKEQLYHGSNFIDPETDQPFTQFGKAKQMYLGYHVGTPEQAHNINLVNRGWGESEYMKPRAYTMPVYIQAKNPLRVSDDEANDPFQLMRKLLKDKKVTPEQYEKYRLEGNQKQNWATAARKIVEDLGHDSLVYQNSIEGKGDSYVLFRPHQIKSAIGNRGTYDPNDPDITKAGGGGVGKGKSVLKELEDYLRQREGSYSVNRLQRAADEIPGLERMYSFDALRRAFGGYNARALMTMNPADFEKFAHRLAFDDEFQRKMINQKVNRLAKLKSGFDDVPFLVVDRRRPDYLPSIEAHEGRHRSRAMEKKGLTKSLVLLDPSSAMEKRMPQKSRENFIEAMKKELGEKRLVTPEGRSLLPADLSAMEHQNLERRGLLQANRPQLPEIYAVGGSVGMGINVATDKKADRRYADLIVDGLKKYESRNTHSLKPYVGKRVAIVRTGEGPARAIGEVTIGEPMQVDAKQFDSMRDEHMVPAGSAFDIQGGTKYLYPMINPKRYKQERDVGHGIVARKLNKADGGTVNQGGNMPTLAEMRMMLAQRGNPINMQSIGVNEAPNIMPKMYMPPDRAQSMQPPPGGVATPTGMPIGGVDQSHMMPGQQLMPQPIQQPAAPQAQGNQPGQQPGGLPAGQPQPGQVPTGQSNILSLTPQGRALGALGGLPGQQPQAMATGGSAKNYSHEVYRRQTGEVKGQYQSVEAARRARDRYDNQYGAYVHGVRPISDSRAGKTASSSLELLAGGGGVKSKGVTMGAPKQTRMVFQAQGPGGVTGINVPRHMWEGSSGVFQKGTRAGQEFKTPGMKDVNAMRAKVYGKENRDPLTIGQIGRIHKDTLAEHFAKPLDEQVKAEKDALGRLREAGHIGKGANTLDESEKLDTVRHEHDEEGRTHVGFASKGVAGHALYTSGHGKNMKHHVINTCPGQTEGCGGGKDAKGVVDTTKGTCFAPVAEAQYPGAAIRRASHEQAKHDPAMTRDWILAHTGSMRDAANNADKKNQRMLFRPNVVDETDTSSRHVIRHLNKQRAEEGKPGIIANSYGKTNELHDPENGYHVTHSNVGPKVKGGKEISENIGRDKQRVSNTILAANNKGDFKNEQGNETPPKGSYMVTNVKRGSPLSKKMEEHITHAKYWSTGREQNELTDKEKDEGAEGHYSASGRKTTPDKSHYGHTTVNGRRYDYQKQHILHPRLVQVGENKDGTPHMIPTDSRFKDTEFLPKNRFKTKNGKDAGHILMTTPTESTSNVGHETSFTHHVDENSIKHAMKNNGEYEIDKPEDQEKARGKEYAAPQEIKFSKTLKLASGGGVYARHPGLGHDDFHAFPESNYAAQRHLAMRRGDDEKDDRVLKAGPKAVLVRKDINAIRHEMMMRKKG